MKAIIIILALFFSGCASIEKKPNEMTKVSEGKYEIENLGRYIRENKCREGHARGYYYCENGKRFRAYHR